MILTHGHHQMVNTEIRLIILKMEKLYTVIQQPLGDVPLVLAGMEPPQRALHEAARGHDHESASELG